MRRWLLIISGITGSVALGGASIFTIAHLQNSNKGALSSSTQVTQPSYQFAYLADQCKQGINNFQQQMDSLKSKEKTVNDDTQQQVASIKSDADMAIAYDTQQSSKFLEESTQPGISAEEENALVQTAQNFSNDSTQRQNSSEQAQLAVLQN